MWNRCFMWRIMILLSVVIIMNGGRAVAAVVREIKPGASPGDKTVTFNFRNVPLDTVLDHLSRAAGFIIIREVGVTGRVDAVSHQALSRQEAFELLNTILRQKGFAAIRNENILRIVTLEEAARRDIPVTVGRDSVKVPRSESVVTQIIPVRHVQASQLVSNLTSLMPAYAVLSTNESSNALVLTATQSDIRRLLQIIEALDTAGGGDATLRLFRLDHADATNIVSLITQLYKSNEAAADTAANVNQPPGMPPLPPEMMMMAAAGGTAGGNTTAASAPRKAAIQTTAVADTRTNTVVVSAAADLMPRIEELIKRLDSDKTRLNEIRICPLHYADAQTLAEQINEVFQPTASSGSAAATDAAGATRLMMAGGPGGGGFPGGPPGEGASVDAAQATTLAVADVRTNSLILCAEKTLLSQIEPLVARLDSDHAREQKVYVYQMKYADAQKTAVLLQGMFGDSTRQSNLTSTDRGGVFSTSNSSNSSSRLRSSNSTGSSSSSSGRSGGMSGGLN